MKIFTFSMLKTVCSTAIVVALLGTTVACTTVTPNYDNQRVYRAQGNHHDNVIYNDGRYNQGNYNHNKRYNNKNGHYKNNKGRYKNKCQYNNNGRYNHNNYHYK